MLVLKAKEVARANIDQFNRLGAFLGKIDCFYHYDDNSCGVACAIGIMDIKGELMVKDLQETPAISLPNYISLDDRYTISFIQELHDFACKANSAVHREDPVLIPLIPNKVTDLMEKIRCPKDLTPELYKEIMRRLT